MESGGKSSAVDTYIQAKRRGKVVGIQQGTGNGLRF